MLNRKHTLFALAFTASTGFMATAALAYDPCQRAQEDVREAENDVRRWVANNCNGNGSCSGNAQRFLILYQRVEDARARASRACI